MISLLETGGRPLTPPATALRGHEARTQATPHQASALVWLFLLTSSKRRPPPPGPLQDSHTLACLPLHAVEGLVLPHEPSSDGVPVIYHIKRARVAWVAEPISQSRREGQAISYILSPPQPAS